MMSITQKWRVTVGFQSREMVLFVNDNHLSNVLMSLAKLQFSENGIEDQPTRMTIARCQ